ncbi:MAG: glycosyltransferase [Acidimicrobiales bacterium]
MTPEVRGRAPEQPGRPEGPGGQRGTTEVAGTAVDTDVAEPQTARARVTIVVAGWGKDWGERRTAVRLVAGALALSCDVSIVSLDHGGDSIIRQPRKSFDGIFPVHSAAATGGSDRIAALASAALGRRRGDAGIPEIASRQLLKLRFRVSSEVHEILAELKPDVVVLAGDETLWMAEALPVGPDRPRVVVLPLLGTSPILSSPALGRFTEIADAIGSFSDHERRLLEGHHVKQGCLRRLHVALPVNREAVRGGLAGTASFGQYVLFISGWPTDEALAGQCPPHEYVRAAVGDVSIAEVRHGGWVVSEKGRRFDVLWTPSRMNLWRLMARAVATVDVRPPGPIGREAIESLMFGTPVVVPSGSVAAEHAAASNGGLWYGSPGEMLDQVRYILDHEDARDALGRSGRLWAEEHHGDTESFVEEATRLILD